MRGQPNSEILEAGLILVVLISIASVGPASWAHSADLMREHTYQLLFAAIATGLCIFERSYAHRAETSKPGRSPRSMRPRQKRVLDFTFDAAGLSDARPVYRIALLWGMGLSLVWLVGREYLAFVDEKLTEYRARSAHFKTGVILVAPRVGRDPLAAASRNACL